MDACAEQLDSCYRVAWKWKIGEARQDQIVHDRFVFCVTLFPEVGGVFFHDESGAVPKPSGRNLAFQDPRMTLMTDNRAALPGGQRKQVLIERLREDQGRV